MVNWEDGQLEQGAYVEINGVRYSVVMPQYSGNTPVTAENLNKMQSDLQEQIDDKNYIVACLNSDYTIQATSELEVLPLTKQNLKVGNKLSINSSGKIVIGAGVNHVKVSGQWYFYTGTINASKNAISRVNNIVFAVDNQYCNAQYQHIGYSETIVSVTEGDTIDLEAQGTANDLVKAYDSGTYLCVEVID